MKKLFSIFFTLLFICLIPTSVFAAQESIGYFKYNETTSSIEYFDSNNTLINHDIIDFEEHVYTVTDGCVSLIDGMKQGTIQTEDGAFYYIDSSHAFNENEYAYIEENVISLKASALVEISGIEYCFKDGVLYTGICDNKFYNNGLFDNSVNGNLTINGDTYYFVNGVLANGLLSSAYYKDGIIDTSKNGITKVGSKNYYFVNGVLSTGMITEIYGENKGNLVYYKKGKFNTKTGPVNVNNYGYYLENGVAKSGKILVKGKYRYYSKKSKKLIKNKTLKINKYLYYSDEKGILSYAPLVYIQQNTQENELIPYPSAEKPKATIASGGCGVCTSLMIINNTTSYSPSLKSWTKKMMKNGCRVWGGTDIRKTAKLMKKTYGFKYKKTSSINELKAHLNKGYMAICNVGGNGYFAYGGHYVVAAGIASNGNVVILDPFMTPTKYYSKCKGVDRRKYFKYDANTNEVTCSFNTLKVGSRGEYYYLFTPTKNITLRKTSK